MRQPNNNNLVYPYHFIEIDVGNVAVDVDKPDTGTITLPNGNQLQIRAVSRDGSRKPLLSTTRLLL
jgi:hypothetical protein